MPNTLSLQYLFQQQTNKFSTDFEKKIALFLNQPNNFADFFPEEECLWQETLFSEEKMMENWKHLLAVNIFSALKGLSHSGIAHQVYVCERQPWNKSSQYCRSIVALNHVLAKLPIPEVGAHLLESGAPLIDLHEYSPWLALPYTPQHYEFGIFLCLLALLTEKDDFKDNISRLTNWQINTLDAYGIPLKGLFAREKDSQTTQFLCLSYLLFRAASLVIQEDNYYHTLAEVSLKSLSEIGLNANEKIHPLWVLIEKWLEKYQEAPKKEISLPDLIHDTSTALAGYRSLNQQVMCTLHGAQTGLGTMRFNDIDIISYGPQHLPLADCEGFGIEGNALSDQGVRRSTIEWKRQSFVLKGCTRMVDQPSQSSSMVKFGNYRGIWLETIQSFKKPVLSVETRFLGLDGWDSIAFSFFVKSEQCIIDDKILLPCTLENYEGEIKSVILHGEDSKIQIKASPTKGKMQIIPLSGGNNFWGAYFLLAYHLTSDQSTYQWQIGPVDS